MARINVKKLVALRQDNWQTMELSTTMCEISRFLRE